MAFQKEEEKGGVREKIMAVGGERKNPFLTLHPPGPYQEGDRVVPFTFTAGGKEESAVNLRSRTRAGRNKGRTPIIANDIIAKARRTRPPLLEGGKKKKEEILCEGKGEEIAHRHARPR